MPLKHVMGIFIVVGVVKIIPGRPGNTKSATFNIHQCILELLYVIVDVEPKKLVNQWDVYVY